MKYFAKLPDFPLRLSVIEYGLLWQKKSVLRDVISRANSIPVMTKESFTPANYRIQLVRL